MTESSEPGFTITLRDVWQEVRAGFQELRTLLDSKADKQVVDNLSLQVARLEVEGSRGTRELMPKVADLQVRVDTLGGYLHDLDTTKKVMESAAEEAKHKAAGRHWIWRNLAATIAAIIAVAAFIWSVIHG